MHYLNCSPCVVSSCKVSLVAAPADVALVAGITGVNVVVAGITDVDVVVAGITGVNVVVAGITGVDVVVAGITGVDVVVADTESRGRTPGDRIYYYYYHHYYFCVTSICVVKKHNNGNIHLHISRAFLSINDDKMAALG